MLSVHCALHARKPVSNRPTGTLPRGLMNENVSKCCCGITTKDDCDKIVVIANGLGIKYADCGANTLQYLVTFRVRHRLDEVKCIATTVCVCVCLSLHRCIHTVPLHCTDSDIG